MQEAENSPIEFLKCRRKRILNGDLFVKNVQKYLNSSKDKLEIAPKIYFWKVVLENQVSCGLKMSLTMYLVKTEGGGVKVLVRFFFLQKSMFIRSMNIFFF